jgi:hypothetical protein
LLLDGRKPTVADMFSIQQHVYAAGIPEFVKNGHVLAKESEGIVTNFCDLGAGIAKRKRVRFHDRHIDKAVVKTTY